jgi:predicted phage terminase large subunit-like protein
MTFKDVKTSDFVCGGVWGRKGAIKYLMPDIVWDRLDFVATKKAVLSLSARWPDARAKWIEDKANGPAIIAELQTEISGLIPVQPIGSKEARLHAAAPDVEAGNVVLPHPSIAPWVRRFIDECAAACCGGQHDDAADMMSQGDQQAAQEQRRLFQLPSAQPRTSGGRGRGQASRDPSSH